MKRSSKKGLLIFILWILTDIFAKYSLDKAGFLDYFHVFDLVIVLIFELYIFFQLPGSEYFWDTVEHVEDPIHRKIRLAVMACIVAFLIFVFKWAYFLAFYFITTIKIDGIINFFRVSREERHQILKAEKNKARADIFDNTKGIAIAVIVLIAILVPYTIHHSKWMHAQFDKIRASANNSDRSAQPSR